MKITIAAIVLALPSPPASAAATAPAARTTADSVLVALEPARPGAPPLAGVLLSAGGHVGTAAAALDAGAPKAARLSDGDVYDDVSVLDVDERRGLALLKIKGFALPAARIADSSSIAGDLPVRVGHLPGVPAWSAHRPAPVLVPARFERHDRGEGYRTLIVRVGDTQPLLGGPVLAEDGSLLGIVTSPQPGDGLVTAVPSSYLAGMLADALRRDDAGSVAVSAGAAVPAETPAPSESVARGAAAAPELAPDAPVTALTATPEATPAAPPMPALALADVRRVAVFPFTSTGSKVDTFWTSIFLQEYRKRGYPQQLIDPYELSVRLDDGAYFHPLGRLPELLADARRVGADAILIGEGKEYSMGFRLEVRLLEANQGQVLWSAAAASGFSLAGPSAKKEDVNKVLRRWPKAAR